MANPTISEVPDLMKIWDFERNEALGHYPTKITTGSSKKLWFFCGNGYRHSFLSRPSGVLRGAICSVCVGKQVAKGYNDFESQCPYESYFWDSTKNNITPAEVARGSNRLYWFICEEGHPFRIRPNSIYYGSSWCPYCSGRFVREGETDFESRCVYESYFWDYSNNRCEPSEVSSGVKEKFSFVCEYGHSFSSSLNNISSLGNWCPDCKPKWSKAEKELYSWISCTVAPGIEVVPNTREILPGGKEIDIYIPSLKLGFEYNGNYWHKDKGDSDGPSAQKERLAREKGVTLYTIWEDDWTSDRSTWEEFIVRAINLTQK